MILKTHVALLPDIGCRKHILQERLRYIAHLPYLPILAYSLAIEKMALFSHYLFRLTMILHRVSPLGPIVFRLAVQHEHHRLIDPAASILAGVYAVSDDSIAPWSRGK